MSTVYQHQLHAHKTRRKHPWRWLLVITFLLGSAIAYSFTLLKPEVTVSKPVTVTKKLDASTAVDAYQKGFFSIELPKGWQFMSKQTDLYTIYHFKGSGAESGNRSLDIFEDSTLPNFAVNRMVPVTANENGGITADPNLVSDNCDAYTTGNLQNKMQVGQLAKWQGIEFLCDKGNTLRNVVGTGSKDGLNNVNVQTETSRVHRYFFAYTDSNIKPDYTIFTTALNSFKVTE